MNQSELSSPQWVDFNLSLGGDLLHRNAGLATNGWVIAQSNALQAYTKPMMN